MASLISVVIPALNEGSELQLTLESLKESDADQSRYQVIVVDDCSSSPAAQGPARPFFDPRLNAGFQATLVRNEQRLGVARSRHRGALTADASHLLFIDGHSRVTPGWLTAIEQAIAEDKDAVWCGKCLGLGYGKTVVTDYNGEYCGATLCLYNEKTHEVFEGKWLNHVPVHAEEIPCLMGASYLIPRAMFFETGGLDSLSMWGSDEPYLSLKYWLSGSKILFLPGLRVGHVFRNSAPYATEIWHLTYNKVRAIRETIHDPHMERFLESKARTCMGGNPSDTGLLDARLLHDHAAIASSRRLLERKFTRSIHWYIDRFKIVAPVLP